MRRGAVGRWLRRAALGAGLVVLLVLLAGLVAYLRTSIPKVSASATAQATSIRFAGGEEIGRIGSQNRQLVPLSAVSDPAQKAVLAAEDRGFYSEPGISVRGILRAAIANVRGGGVSQGGSTITQQYAKNAFLTPKRTLGRKLTEFFVALKLARTVPKSTILADYLNTIYFGRGASGIEVAALTYFGVHAADLSVAQGAVLAASIRSPSGYDPTTHPAAARARWDYVLDGMVRKGWLSGAERASVRYPVVLAPGQNKAGRANDLSGPNGYVIAQVERELGQHGFSEDKLATGGYVVQTSIRRQAQEAAVAAMSVLPSPAAGDRSAVEGALVSVVPGTGEVYAYYGGRNGNRGFDYADGGSGVQAGSSFKPFTLTAALEQGIGLSTRVDGSSPQQFAAVKVQNDKGDPPFGYIDLVTATKYSVNTAYYNLAKQVGPQHIADVAHSAGIPASDRLADASGAPTLGITLGIYDVHVLDQAVAYATFADNGIRARPFFVKTVRDADNHEVYRAHQLNDRAFGADVSADATAAMQSVLEPGGTGSLATLAGGRPAAGKTGTTSGNTDAWFCGYTPQLATAVWLGRADSSPLKGVLGSVDGVYGGTVPAQIWKAYMDRTLAGEPVRQFPPRANVGHAAPTSSSPGGGYTTAPVPVAPPSAPSASASATTTGSARPVVPPPPSATRTAAAPSSAPPPPSAQPPPPATASPPPPASQPAQAPSSPPPSAGG